MSIRSIKIASSTKTSVQVLQSEAVTWGQLKDSLSDYGDLSKMTAMVKETRHTLQLDDAVLPEGDFTLYLSPKNIKAGSEKSVQILKDLKEGFIATIDEIIENIEEGDYDHLSESKSKSVPKSAEDENFLKKLAGF